MVRVFFVCVVMLVGVWCTGCAKVCALVDKADKACHTRELME